MPAQHTPLLKEHISPRRAASQPCRYSLSSCSRWIAYWDPQGRDRSSGGEGRRGGQQAHGRSSSVACTKSRGRSSSPKGSGSRCWRANTAPSAFEATGTPKRRCRPRPCRRFRNVHSRALQLTIAKGIPGVERRLASTGDDCASGTWRPPVPGPPLPEQPPPARAEHGLK